jgi:hypothetical protein
MNNQLRIAGRLRALWERLTQTGDFVRQALSDGVRAPTALAWFAPLACAIHCLAAPMLVLIVPEIPVSARAEWWLFTASLGFTGWLIVRGWWVHRRMMMVGLGTGGLFLWGASLAHLTRPIPEPITTALGALLVSVALYSNARAAHLAARQPCGGDC